MNESRHLSEIIGRHNHIANLQVVFVDIEQYSKRRTQSQAAVIDAFTECLERALSDTAKSYLTYAQQNDLNFSTDIVKVATGDGAAIGFTFDGLHDIHLTFAKSFLREAYQLRHDSPCTRFDEAGWCNCHTHFNARVGVAEGKAILYRDIKGDYNFAGGTVNLAARVMAIVSPNQIAFTEAAYEQLVDMVDDPGISDYFRRYDNVRLKHGERLTIYQYISSEDAYVNSDLAEDLDLEQQLDSAMSRLSTTGFPVPDFAALGEQSRLQVSRQMLAMFEQLETLTKLGKGLAQQEAAIEADSSEPRKSDVDTD